MQQDPEEGLSQEATRAEAQRRFGNGTGCREKHVRIEDRRRKGHARLNIITDFVTDIRLAGRNMRKHPGFTLVSLLILAIGIGGVTVMYSTLNGVALRLLPYDEPDRLVWVQAITDAGRPNTVAALDYFDYRQQCSSFASLGAHLTFRPGVIITGEDEPERVISTTVSHNLFSTLGIAPLHGRTFTLDEEVLGGPNVVTLSYGLWQRRYGGDPSIVGMSITINGAPFDVVGVMPDGYDYPAGVQLWSPMQRGGPSESGRGNNNFSIIGRLAGGVTIEQAQSEMDVLAANISEAYPDSKGGWGIQLVRLHDRFFASIRSSMLLLLGAVSLVLLIVCANLSSLFLAKVTSRQNEFAIRLSLGASRGAVLRQLLTESLVITLLGSLCGILLALLGIHVLKIIGPGNLPRLQTVSIDTTVLAVMVTVSILTGLLFGIVPAVRSSRVSLVQSLKESGRSTEGMRSLRTRGVLVVAQVAFSLILLIVSGLLIRSFLRLQQVDPGMEPAGLLTMSVQLPAFTYTDPGQREQFFDETLEQIRALPGVLDASAVDGFPLYGGLWNGIWPADRPPADASERIAATRRFAMDGYFRTLGVPVLAGRTFESTDRTGSQTVTVVSQTLAKQVFQDENAVGKILILPWGDGIPLEIIGVVGDLPDYGLGADFRPVFYLPNRQYPQTVLSLVIRVDGEPTALTPAIRTIIWEVDKDVPITNVSTIEARISGSTAGFRFQTLLFGTFAAIAIILASIGLYGVLAYFVSQRTREMGIRIALGAGPNDVMYEVIRRGVIWAGSGLAFGLLGGLIASMLLRSMLFATAPTDPLTYLLVSLFLALVAFLACLIPARRAVRVDPLIALRAE